MDTSRDGGSSGIIFEYLDGNKSQEAERTVNGMRMTKTEFLDNALEKAEDLIPVEWPEYECAGTDDLLEAARIFECDIPAFGELSSSSCSSASASSPSSSWVQTERHSSSCAASSTPSFDQEITICADSATSSSYHNSLVPTLQSARSGQVNENGRECSYFTQTSNVCGSEKIDVLEELQNLDLLVGSEAGVPFSIVPHEDSGIDGFPTLGSPGGADCSEELPKVFFEWLKSNRDSISPEDLRSIRLKRSTIENAAKHLGGEKKGMLHLLKLILAWVQDHHLQRKRKQSDEHSNSPFGERLLNDGICTGTPLSYFGTPMEHINLWNGGPENGNVWDPFRCAVSLNYDPSLFTSIAAPALHPTKYRRVNAEDASSQLREVPNLVGGGAAGFGNPMLPECRGMVNCAAWLPHMATLGVASNQHRYTGFNSACGDKYRFAVQSPMDYVNFRSHATPASTTKEARKNRMARQRRSGMAHPHHQNRHWPSPSSPALLSQPSDLPVNNLRIMQQYPRQALLATERRQGWKPEKNLKFLLQKVLKQSDVGNLGRIVLPKKEAETHLPELEARDGISIAMEDIVTSRVWNMRYRFWPNNKSRMYLLENTGEFVRSNGLHEGDFIVIYSDTKTGKYMIRGVKVPRSDASEAITTKSTTGCSRGDGEDSNLMNMEKRYGGNTSRAVAVTFPDSMGDASSSVSGVTQTRSCDEDPFLNDILNEFPKNLAQGHCHHHLERFPSLDSADLTIEEILDLVDSPHITVEPLTKFHEATPV